MSKRLKRKDRAKKAAMIGIPVVGIFAGLGKLFSKRRARKQAQKEGKSLQYVEQKITMNKKPKMRSL